MGCTWNADLEQANTAATARAMRAVGATQALSPMLDVIDNARWGRAEEGFGEEPYLTAFMGVSFIRGLQGPDLRQDCLAGIGTEIAEGTEINGHAFLLFRGRRLCLQVAPHRSTHQLTPKDSFELNEHPMAAMCLTQQEHQAFMKLKLHSISKKTISLGDLVAAVSSCARNERETVAAIQDLFLRGSVMACTRYGRKRLRLA